MKRIAAGLGIVSGIMFALGKNPTSLMASSYVLLIFIAFGKFIAGDKKPFGQPFWTALFILLFLPFMVCNFINWMGLPTFAAVILLSAALYIYFNTNRDHTSKIPGGERSPLNESHFSESDFNDSEFDKYSWDDREVN